MQSFALTHHSFYDSFLPALIDREVLRLGAVSADVWKRIRYSEGLGLTLPHISHLPLALSIVGAKDMVSNLNLKSLRTVQFNCFLRGSDVGKPWFLENSTVCPPNQSLGRLLLALTDRLRDMRSQTPASAPVLQTLEYVGCDYISLEDYDEFKLETADMLAALFTEAPIFRGFDLGTMLLDVKKLCSSVTLAEAPGLASITWTGQLQESVFPRSEDEASNAGRLLRCMTRLQTLELFNLEEIGFPKGTMFAAPIFRAFVQGFCSQAAKQDSAINHLSLTAIHLSDSGPEMARLLSAMPHLRTLSFGGFDEDDFPCVLSDKTIADWTTHGQHALAQLESLCFRGFSCDGINLALVLRHSLSLRVLDLSTSEFGDEEVVALADSVTQPLPALEILDLHECALETSNAGAALGKLISMLGNMQCLHLYGNLLGIDAYTALARELAVQAASRLRLLDIGGHKLQPPPASDVSCSIVRVMMSSCKFIEELYLQNLCLDAQAWRNLRHAPPNRCRNLQILGLSACIGLNTVRAGKHLAGFLQARLPSLSDLVFKRCASLATLRGIAWSLSFGRRRRLGLKKLHRLIVPSTFRHKFFSEPRPKFWLNPMCQKSRLKHILQTSCPKFASLEERHSAWCTSFIKAEAVSKFYKNRPPRYL